MTSIPVFFGFYGYILLTALTISIVAFLFGLNIVSKHISKKRQVYFYYVFAIVGLAGSGLVILRDILGWQLALSYSNLFVLINCSALSFALLNITPFAKSWWLLASFHCLAIIINFTLTDNRSHLALISAYISLLFAYISPKLVASYKQEKNIGFLIKAFATSSAIVFGPVALFLLYKLNDITIAYLMLNSLFFCGFLMICYGFLLTALVSSRNKLKQYAHLDPLTEMFNRRGLEASLDHIEKLNSTQGVCLIITDIDYFKAVNDQHGHGIGDLVLEEFSTIIRDSIRSLDFCARLGGEEFAIVLPNTHYDDATKLAHRIRNRIEQHTFTFDSTELSITASFGVVKGESGKTFTQLLQQADQALYRAKQTGRNQVVTDTTDDNRCDNNETCPA